LKNTPLYTLNHPDSKSLIKIIKDYNIAKDRFNTEENYLKKKIGEILNQKPK
jgi:hypothetical protein